MRKLLPITIPFILALLMFSGCAQKRVKTTSAVASMRAAKDAISSAMTAESPNSPELDQLLREMSEAVDAALSSGEPIGARCHAAFETGRIELTQLHEVIKDGKHVQPTDKLRAALQNIDAMAERSVSAAESWLRAQK